MEKKLALIIKLPFVNISEHAKEIFYLFKIWFHARNQIL